MLPSASLNPEEGARPSLGESADPLPQHYDLKKDFSFSETFCCSKPLISEFYCQPQILFNLHFPTGAQNSYLQRNFNN